MHTFRTHDLVMTPKKKGVGGITKYDDVTSKDLNYELMDVDQTRLVKPLFQVEKCRQINPITGLMEDLPIPIIMKPQKLEIKNKIQKFKHKIPKY